MRTEFIKALADGKSLEQVKDRLENISRKLYTRELEQIRRDYEEAQALAIALKAAPDSAAHRMAAAIIADAKDEPDSDRDALRQEIEDDLNRSFRDHLHHLKATFDEIQEYWDGIAEDRRKEFLQWRAIQS